MNIFLACFLACLFALIAHHVGWMHLTQWRMRRRYEQARKAHPELYKSEGKLGPIPMSIFSADFKPPKCFFTCVHCNKESELQDDKVRFESA